MRTLVLLGCLVMVGCRKGGGSHTPEAASVDVSGDWAGTFFRVNPPGSGNTGQVRFSLDQEGSAVAGTMTVPFDPCSPSSRVVAVVTGRTLVGTAVSGEVTVNLRLTMTEDGTLSGTYNHDPNPCSFGSGTVLVTRLARQQSVLAPWSIFYIDLETGEQTLVGWSSYEPVDEEVNDGIF